MDAKQLKKIVGFEIYRRRHDMGVPQWKLAELLGTSQSTVSHWERRDWLPETILLYRLADVFGCTVDELLGR